MDIKLTKLLTERRDAGRYRVAANVNERILVEVSWPKS